MSVKSNETLGYNADLYERTADAGTTLTVTVSVAGNGDAEVPSKWRATAELYHHEQDASKEGVRDRIAARGRDHGDALANLLAIVNDQWTMEQAKGVRRAIADIDDDMAEDAE